MINNGQLIRVIVLCAMVFGLIAPIVLGLWQTVKAAFGFMPALGLLEWSTEPWQKLQNLSGFSTSLRLTLTTGFGATLVSFLLATGVCTTLQAYLRPSIVARILTPFLATPHAAIAVGLTFVLAPSGWIARMLSGPLGWENPPDLSTVNDSWGLALMLGLIVKEVPFLLFLILSALSQISITNQMATARSLGYTPSHIWIKVIMPQVWPLIRLPFWVVLAYSLSVVDMAIILGPSNPPTLAVAVTRWFSSHELSMLAPASAGALLQAMIVLLSLVFVYLCELLIRHSGVWWLRKGSRGTSINLGIWITTVCTIGLMILASLTLLSLFIWSLTWRWSFPRLIPESWSLRAWTNSFDSWGVALGNTLALASATTLISLIITIAWLETEDSANTTRSSWINSLIYLPLLVPQITFLYGLNVVFLSINFSASYIAVIWAQTLFVFPYMMIALSDPWRAMDPRFTKVGAALGAGPWKRLISIKLHVLLRPILTAISIGVAVSVAQYLPTLFIGAGRINTLTTEAVTLSSGSDRRITAVYASLQAALPFIIYLVAFLLPAVLHRNRRDLIGVFQK